MPDPISGVRCGDSKMESHVIRTIWLQFSLTAVTLPLRNDDAEEFVSDSGSADRTSLQTAQVKTFFPTAHQFPRHHWQ
jgi:hypothetical protein